MDEQAQLKEALSALMSLAAASDGHLTVEQIEDACSGIGLSDKQMQMVCTYLEMNRVTIDDFSASEEDKALLRDTEDSETDKDQTGADSAYFKMYLSELEGIVPCTEEETAELIELMLAGDEAARERLIEGNLHRVVQMSREYLGQGVLAADLVQEGNMALLLAMSTYDRRENLTVHLLTEVENAMVEAIREQTGEQDVGRSLAADANLLMKATETLAEKLGREATAGELAEHLHFTEDRVETLVKISLDAMNLSEE